VPAENLIGEENKGWTYAKHLLSHERTNIADVNRAKRELERLKRIAKAEGVWDDQRFRDQIALLEVDVVALEMLVLRVLSAEKSGKNPLDIAGLLKIKGSEIQQRYSELMMLAAGPYALPFIQEAMEAGWQGFPGGVLQRAAGRDLLQHAQDHHLRRQQRSATQHRRPDGAGLKETSTWISIFPTTSNNCATPCAAGWTRAIPSSAAAPSWQPAAFARGLWRAGRAGPDGPHRARGHGGLGQGAVEAMVVMEELGRGIVMEPWRRPSWLRRARPVPTRSCRPGCPASPAARPGGAGPAGAQGALPPRRLRGRQSRRGYAWSHKKHSSRRRPGRRLHGARPAGRQDRASWSSAAPRRQHAGYGTRTAAAPPTCRPPATLITTDGLAALDAGRGHGIAAPAPKAWARWSRR
jgi:hypothetical protein